MGRCTSTGGVLVTTVSTTILLPFVQDYPGELVSEEIFWVLWCSNCYYYYIHLTAFFQAITNY